MAVIQMNLSSRYLMMDTSVTVIIPVSSGGNNEKTLEEIYRRDVKYPTLYLLHGYSGDSTNWLRYTSIERYANEKRLAVVMPSGYNSFYTDIPYGLRCWSYISEELPLAMRAIFPLSEKRDENFVAGLSMGGYGAMKWALRKPEFFSAAASLSGALDIAEIVESAEPDGKRGFENVFGDLSKLRGSDNDLFYLAENLVKENKTSPRLYIACGTEDFLYPANIRFKEHLIRLGYDITYEEGRGTHNWYFWDKYIRRVIDWIFSV